MARYSSHASDARVLEKRPHAGRRSPVLDRLITLPGSSHPISSAVAAAGPFRTDQRDGALVEQPHGRGCMQSSR